ncbi:MAG: Abi family protein [Dehalococcoidia bacterium]
MKYLKPALTFEQQADKLLERGLVADRTELLARLKSVSYYRLSGYWFPLRQPDDTFKEGTSLTTVWRRYTFDRRLRLAVLDAIERVEICIRTELVYRLAHSQGAFGYCDPANLPNLSAEAYAKFITEVAHEYQLSREQFIDHFRKQYGTDHPLPPYWMVTELMTFGMLLTLFKGCETKVKQQVATRFGIADRVLESWLRALNGVRNICAHHGRLWNRELGYKPMIPRKDIRWHHPVEIPDNRVFGVLTILKFLLADIAPQSSWNKRIDALFAEYPEIPRQPMGYPEDWEKCPIWLEKVDS